MKKRRRAREIRAERSECVAPEMLMEKKAKEETRNGERRETKSEKSGVDCRKKSE